MGFLPSTVWQYVDIYHDYIHVCPERCWGVATVLRQWQQRFFQIQSEPHTLITNSMGFPKFEVSNEKKPKLFRIMEKYPMFFFRGSSGVSNGLPRRAKDLFQRAQRAWKATKSEDSGRGSWVVLRQSAGVGKSFYECLFNLRIHRIIYWPLVRGGISFVVFVLLSWKVQFFFTPRYQCVTQSLFVWSEAWIL